MVIRRRHLEYLVTAFFAVMIAVVFQQIATSMTEQGIASGGPYDNAAAYPRVIAIIIGVLLVILNAASFIAKRDVDEEMIELASLGRPTALLAIFAVYLGLLGVLGYHITTPPMLFTVMYLAGMRKLVLMVVSSVIMSIFFAFMFEFFLKIVLPGGVFGLNIPWS